MKFTNLKVKFKFIPNKQFFQCNSFSAKSRHPSASDLLHFISHKLVKSQTIDALKSRIFHDLMPRKYRQASAANQNNGTFVVILIYKFSKRSRELKFVFMFNVHRSMVLFRYPKIHFALTGNATHRS